MRLLFTTVFLTPLLVLLPCTRVRAQLRPDAPALTWLADHLSELGVAGEVPNGDFGPTRRAHTRSILLWQPGSIGAGWRGFASGHTGVGNFTPYAGSGYRRHKINTTFAAGDDQYAFQVSAEPFSRQNHSVGFSHFADHRFRDADNNERNDLTNRTTTTGHLFGEWGDGEYNGQVYVDHLADQANRDGRFRTDHQRTIVSLSNNYWTYNPRIFSTLNYLRENSERRFEDRRATAERQTVSFRVGLRDEVLDDRLGYTASAIALYQEDELAIPGQRQRRREQLFAFNGLVRYDVARFRLRYHQQLRYRRTDSITYRPNLMVTWFPRNVDLTVTALANRGGAYRNPLLADDELHYTRRTYHTENLRPEDFWRAGLTVQGRFFGTFDVDLQAFAVDYRRYTAVRYGNDGTLTVDQASGAIRHLAVAQLSYWASFIQFGYRHPSVSLNYRYDDLRPDDSAGILHPPRHAAWVRLKVPYEQGYRSEWKAELNAGFLVMSSPNGVNPEAALKVQDRCDASLKVAYERYWFALRAEQFLRNEPLYPYGFDPLGGGEDIPLGNENSVLTGRRFTVAAGVGLWDD